MNMPALKDFYLKIISSLSAGTITPNSITTTIKSNTGTPFPLALSWETISHEGQSGTTLNLTFGDEIKCLVVAETWDENCEGGYGRTYLRGGVTMKMRSDECNAMMEQLCSRLISTPSNVFGAGALDVLLLILHTFACRPQAMKDLMMPNLCSVLSLPEWYYQIVNRILSPACDIPTGVIEDPVQPYQWQDGISFDELSCEEPIEEYYSEDSIDTDEYFSEEEYYAGPRSKLPESEELFSDSEQF